MLPLPMWVTWDWKKSLLHRRCTIDLSNGAQSGSYEITGIPVGTFFKVEEVSADDGSTLDSILIDGIKQPKGTTAAKGDIKPSETTVETTVETTFRNTKKPVVNISVEKLWKNADESVYKGALPEKIYVQLQRRQSDTDTWASADGKSKDLYRACWQYVHRKVADFLYRIG